MPGDNIYPDLSNDKFDIQYARLLGLSSDLRASFGVVATIKPPGDFGPIEKDSDIDTGLVRFGVAGEDHTATENRSFDLAGAYSFALTQLGNNQFLVDPANGLYQLGAVPVPGSDSGLSYTYLEVNDTDGKILLQAPEGIVFPGYGYGNHAGTETFFLAIDAAGNLIEVDAPTGGATMRFGYPLEDVLAGENRSFNTNGYTFGLGETNAIFTLSTANGISLQSNDGTNIYNISMPTAGLPTFQLLASRNASPSSSLIQLSPYAGNANVALTGGDGTNTHAISIFSSSGIYLTSSGIANTIVFMQNLPAMSTETDVLYYNPLSGQITYGAAGGGSITADNGLTASTSTNVQLGGPFGSPSTLLNSRYIDAGAFTLNITTAGGTTPLSVATASSGTAILASTVDGVGINAYATGSGYGVYGQGESGAGVVGQSNTGRGGDFLSTPSSTNTTVTVVNMFRGTSGTAAANMAGRLNLQLKDASNNIQDANSIIWKWTDPATATRTSQLDITGVNSAVTATIFSLLGSGQLQLPKYGIGTFTGTDAYWLAVDSSGNIIEMAAPTGGGGYTNLTQFVAQNNWKVFYSDGSGDVQELSLGANGTVLTSNGTTSAPSFSAPSGGSDTNFAEDDLTFTGSRYHTLGGNFCEIQGTEFDMGFGSGNFYVDNVYDANNSAFFNINVDNSNNTTNQVAMQVKFAGAINKLIVRSDNIEIGKAVFTPNNFYTPSSSGDSTYDVRTLTWDNDYIYVRTTGSGWKKIAWTAF